MSDEIGEELADWGRVLILETRGRRTGRPVRAAVGFVARDERTFVVAAGDPESDWALNLRADPACRIRIGDRELAADAVELAGAERAVAIRDLILRYGTPAERLGAGPAFALVAVDDPAD